MSTDPLLPSLGGRAPNRGSTDFSTLNNHRSVRIHRARPVEAARVQDPPCPTQSSRLHRSCPIAGSRPPKIPRTRPVPRKGQSDLCPHPTPAPISSPRPVASFSRKRLTRHDRHVVDASKVYTKEWKCVCARVCENMAVACDGPRLCVSVSSARGTGSDVMVSEAGGTSILECVCSLQTRPTIGMVSALHEPDVIEGE